MDGLWRYRGRVLTETDVAGIQALIAAHPTASRRALSEQLCAAWDWRQPNGALCAMVCRWRSHSVVIRRTACSSRCQS